jgi:hypothetical protein
MQALFEQRFHYIWKVAAITKLLYIYRGKCHPEDSATHWLSTSLESRIILTFLFKILNRVELHSVFLSLVHSSSLLSSHLAQEQPRLQMVLLNCYSWIYATNLWCSWKSFISNICKPNYTKSLCRFLKKPATNLPAFIVPSIRWGIHITFLALVDARWFQVRFLTSSYDIFDLWTFISLLYTCYFCIKQSLSQSSWTSEQSRYASPSFMAFFHCKDNGLICMQLVDIFILSDWHAQKLRINNQQTGCGYHLNSSQLPSLFTLVSWISRDLSSTEKFEWDCTLSILT